MRDGIEISELFDLNALFIQPKFWGKIVNGLTFYRMLINPLPMLGIVSVGLIFENVDAFYIAGVLYIFASITDFLDGSLARFFNATSDLGGRLDECADKVHAYVGFFLLLFPMIFWWHNWWAALGLVAYSALCYQRDKEVTAWRKIVKLQSSIWGKLKTVFVMTGMSMAFLGPYYDWAWLHITATICMFCGAILTFTTWRDYKKMYLQKIS